MVHQEEAKREKWTEREISVDHPLRKKELLGILLFLQQD